MAKKAVGFGNRLSAISVSPEQQVKEQYSLKPIPLNKLYANEGNFYSKDEIEALATSISICGLHHFIVVKPADADGRHMIVDGERRYLAHKLLVEAGEERFTIAMCEVCPEESLAMTKYRMLSTNATSRILSDADKVRQAVELKAVYEQLRVEGVIQNGEIRKYVAETLKVSESQIAIYNKINKKLEPALRQAFNSGRLEICEASRLASLPSPEQRMIADALANGEDQSTKPPKSRVKKHPIENAITALEKAIASLHKDDNYDASNLIEECAHLIDLLRRTPQAR